MAEEKNEIRHVPTYTRNALHEQEIGHETDVVLLDTSAAHLEKGQYGNLKLAKDGHTVLVPQPSADPNDPLNWSWKRKHLMLAVISLTAFLGDFGSGAGIPLIVLQGEEWNMTPPKVNEAGNLNVLMLCVCSLIFVHRPKLILAAALVVSFGLWYAPGGDALPSCSGRHFQAPSSRSPAP
jgi:hypothetical protein